MNSGVSNTSTPMNPAGNSTSTPIESPECEATLSKYAETCSAEGKELLTFGSKVPKETQDCLSANSCTLKQKDDFLKLACPTFKKYSDCMEPAMDCLLEAMSNDARESFTQSVRECDAFSASGGSTNTANSGNGKNVASLFSILAFSLFL